MNKYFTMEENELKETKEQKIELGTKAILFLVVRIIICIVLIWHSIWLVIISDQSGSSMAQINLSISTYSISAYNSRYVSYEGNNKSASEVRSLLHGIMIHNSNTEEVVRYGKISVNYNGQGSKEDTFIDDDLQSIINQIKDSKYYQVRVESYYSNYGSISRIRINQQSSHDDVIKIPIIQYNDILTTNEYPYSSLGNDDNPFSINNWLFFVLGLIMCLSAVIILVNSLVILFRKKCGKANSIIDMLFIVLLFIPLAFFFLIGSIELLLNSEIWLSIFCMFTFVCLLIYFIKIVRLFKKCNSISNYNNMIGSIILFLIFGVVLFYPLVLVYNY